MIKDLDKFWKKEFGSHPPLAHELKVSFAERWVRFHSLPESKRYAEIESEYDEIFYRHNCVLMSRDDNAKEFFIVLPEYSESKTPDKPASELNEILPKSKYWCSLDQSEECGVYWHLHAAQIPLESEELKKILRMVANDEVRNIILVSLGCGMVFHPYDGGADVILRTTEERDKLKQQFSSWLSKHPSGY